MSTVDDIAKGLAIGQSALLSLGDIMAETHRVAATHHNKHKARAARKLLSAHQRTLQKHGLVWVEGKGIQTWSQS